MMELRKPLLAVTLAAGAFVAPNIENVAIVYADAAARVCVDATGGSIGPEDGLPIAAIQEAVGAQADGVFGTDTCRKVWGKLIELGDVTGSGTTIKIGPTVMGWLGVSAISAPTTTTPITTETTPPSTTDKTCPTNVTSLSNLQKTCIEQAKAMLRADGFVDDDITRALKGYQIEAGISSQGQSGFGSLGPATYSALMSGSGVNTMNSAPDKILNGIVVDKSDQTLLVYKGGKIVLGALISTGLSTPAENRETRVGTFKIQRSRTDEDGWVLSSLQSPLAEPAMYIPNYFNGGQAIHGTPAEGKLGRKASHGCVRTAKNIQDKLISQRMLFVKQVVVIQE